MQMKKQSVKNVHNGRTKIHNVRFYNLTPRSIQCFAFNKVWNKLALSRSDGSIEIWDMQHAPCMEKTILKTPGNSVEGLVWSGERLFSVGLIGELVEWNLRILQPRRVQHVTGNAIWCVDVNALGTELAIGTEEGYINIFDIADDQMQYKQLFDKQEGRVLCCKFDHTGAFLVTGSIGTIRIWNVQNGHALHKLKVARSEKNNDVIVWSLQVLSDFSIIAGDSRGQINVWDGRNGTRIDTHQVLEADVLTVAVNEEENMLMCSGIEPKIKIYAKTQIKREDMLSNRWVPYLVRSVHDHDVKALVCTAGDRIISGGMDGYLGVSSILKGRQSIAKYGPFLQKPCATISPGKKLILLRYTNYLEIWRLGSTSGKALLSTADDLKSEIEKPKIKLQRKLLALEEAPEKLLEFKSKNEEPIVCATLSPDSQWLCYSTLHEIRLFRLVVGIDEQQRTQLARLKDLPEQFCAASHVQFATDSKSFFLVDALTKHINKFAILSNGNSDFDFIECIEAGKHIKDNITLLTLSPCGLYVVAAGVDRTIAVWRVFEGKHYRHHLNLPRYSAATTALAVHAEQPRLVASFADGKIFEYDLEELCFTCSSHEYFVANGETHCIGNIILDKRNPNIFLLHNDVFLFSVEKKMPNRYAAGADAGKANSDDAGQVVEKKKPKRVITNDKVPNLILKMQQTYEHFIHLAWLSEDELVAVGVNPITLIEQLPNAFKQKKFGCG